MRLTTNPLNVKGTFHVQAGNGVAQAAFLVIKGRRIPLFSKQTGMDLGILKIRVDFAAIAETSQLLQHQNYISTRI